MLGYGGLRTMWNDFLKGYFGEARKEWFEFIGFYINVTNFSLLFDAFFCQLIFPSCEKAQGQAVAVSR